MPGRGRGRQSRHPGGILAAHEPDDDAPCSLTSASSATKSGLVWVSAGASETARSTRAARDLRIVLP